jgi:hypothetical protein
MNRREAFGILGRVREELGANRFALYRVLEELDESAGVYRAAMYDGVTRDQLKRCARNQEATFVLRLFAEFEAILRDFWRNGIGKGTEPEMRPLMESIARRRAMNDDDLARAHEVREYRNVIIHENLRDERFDFPSCRRTLGVFLSWLPLEW